MFSGESRQMMLFLHNTLHIMQLTVLTLAIAVGALAQVSDSQVPVGHYSTEHTKNLSHSQFPNVTYPDGISPNPNAVLGAQTNQTSPPRYPSPFGSGAGGWAEAYKKAINIVEHLTLEEKVNLTTGKTSILNLHHVNKANQYTRIRLAARTVCWSDWWCASPWYPRTVSPGLACWCEIYRVSAQL
jgi:hypothetical protein